MTGVELRRERVALGLTQRTFAARIGVEPNTVARYERGELHIPQTMALVLDAKKQLGQGLREAGEKTQQLQDDINALHAKVTHLELVNLALNEHLRRRRSRPIVTPRNQRPSDGAGAKAEQIHRWLVRKYHSDRHPQHAEIMADINELWQAWRGR